MRLRLRIHDIIARAARQEFARAMRFRDGVKLDIPPCSLKEPRLLYIHIPFCEKLCPYCSFHRVVFEDTLCRDYFHALRKEILLYREKGYDFRGLYVGGGTPTILIDELEKTIALARECFSIQEISVETNPNHLTDKNMTVLKRAGVSRLSIGVQSFDDGLLKEMGRYDKYGSGEVIAERLRQTLGLFATLNADMIFNFPSQTMAGLGRDLDILMETGADQITYYPLMVSDSTRGVINKTLGQVDYDREKQFYRRIVKRLTPAYRFSSAWCFSKTKTVSIIDEYIVDYDEYAGLGSGAIGYLDGKCYANTFDIQEYIAAVNRGEMPLLASSNFPLKDRIRYDFLMKLFGTKLDVPALRKKYSGRFYRYLWPDVLVFVLTGNLRYHPPCFYLTEQGCYTWFIMMREFFIAVNNFRDFCRAKIMP